MMAASTTSSASLRVRASFEYGLRSRHILYGSGRVHKGILGPKADPSNFIAGNDKRAKLPRAVPGRRFAALQEAGSLARAAPQRSCRMRVSTRAAASDEQALSTLTITKPDDWHLHLRDGAAMECVLPFSAQVFSRAIIMPNLRPPVTTTEAALHYKERIENALPRDLQSFKPLMTLYLTDTTTPDDIHKAKESGFIKALKLYPAGATTNSDQGVTDLLGRCLPTLETMASLGIPLLVHGEVVDPDIDFFDREAVFIQRVLTPLMETLPTLRVIMEHVTTEDAVNFVLNFPEDRIAATVTPQHMLWNRNSLFLPGGIRPHNFCLPILKREKHREAVTRAATSGSPRIFLGTDSAPHEKKTKETACGCAGIFSAHAALPLYATIFEQAQALDKLEAFASFNGPDFYGLPRNSERVKLVKLPWKVPAEYPFGSEGGMVVPMFAGDMLEWQVVKNA